MWKTPIFIIGHILLFLIVEHTVTVALKIGIGYLLTELAAHTFIFLKLTKLAGAIAPLLPKPLLDAINYLTVLVKSKEL